MVWFHPGGFALSDGSAETYGPDYFMDYEIILVRLSKNIHFKLLTILTFSKRLPWNSVLESWVTCF